MFTAGDAIPTISEAGISSLVLNGGASLVTTGTVLRIVDNQDYQQSTAWYSTRGVLRFGACDRRCVVRTVLLYSQSSRPVERHGNVEKQCERRALAVAAVLPRQFSYNVLF